MFDEWQQSFAEHPSAPVQLRFLLAAAVECNHVRYYVLRRAVHSSPHFSDAGFTKTLINRLINQIGTETDREMKKLAMLCFCVLCAIDSELITVYKA